MSKKKLLITIFLSLIVNFIYCDNVFAANPYAEQGPYGTNCTWYAWKMANEKGGVSLPGWGNAKDWYNQAKNAGYSVGTTPKANSIIVWSNWTEYGHVGYVESVSGDTLYVWDSAKSCINESQEFWDCIYNGVSEETDKICRANAERIACERSASSSGYNVAGYIYLDYAPTKPVVSDKTTTNKVEEKKEEIIKKSNNTNLSKIELSYGNIDFNKDIVEYNFEVPNEIDKIVVNAELEDNKSKLNGTGEYNLNIGINDIKLKVIAEDETTKEYNVKITRLEKIKEEIKENVVEEDNVKSNYNWLFVIIPVSILTLVIIILLINTFKTKRKK